jgi:hypothetical protein
LLHLQNPRPYPSADAEGREGCNNHHYRSDFMLTTATTMARTMIIEDGETT